MKNNMILGIDIGGSHITAALVDENSKQIYMDSYKRLHVNSNAEAEEILNIWSALINEIFNDYNISNKKIGMAMPGPFDYEKGISYIKGLDKYDALYELNIKELLANKLGISPKNILMMNDAACFLLGEVQGGAAKGFQDVIGITLGTGTGTAIYHRGVIQDANLGPSPFKNSIADNYFSTRWFVNRYEEISSIKVNNVKELTELYDTDERVRALFTEFTNNLTDFLEAFIMRENPQIVVIGGNIAQGSHLFLTDLKKNLEIRGVNVPLVTAQLGEDAAILGAASLFNN